MIQFTQIEQSRVHLALCRALGVTDDPKNTEERARHNYAHWASHDPIMLREAGLLATALTDHAQRADFCFRMSELAAAADHLEMAQCAGELMGAVHIGRGVWSTAPKKNAPRVSVPTTLFRAYLEEWACHLPFDEDHSI
ncbi:hypothetical protein DS909_05605 [Phaeobacter gallaeciensis]|uniref:Uncharacterized protein n=1 Tax=Phaeobacter gallaeciensis TaxID=60890 RepID=A0A366X465_9RHOB|nr:hypothetical protein [Phaeobacter gallaeciensis]RBW58441.1 hypothetical protein DS909_05605 [Phaeobacter gallaeciensis]